MSNNNNGVEYIAEPLVTWYKIKWAILYWLIITGSLWTGFQVQDIWREIGSAYPKQEAQKHQQ